MGNNTSNEQNSMKNNKNHVNQWLTVMFECHNKHTGFSLY